MNVAVCPTPVGEITLIADGGVLIASGWTHDVHELAALAAGSGAAHRTFDLDAHTVVDHIPGITDVLAAYLDGELSALDKVAVLPIASGPIVGRAWSHLRTIRAGSTVTYGELAEAAGLTRSAARVAARACSANHAAPFVPCHRVLHAGGGREGYRYGSNVKNWLLAHEQR